MHGPRVAAHHRCMLPRRLYAAGLGMVQYVITLNAGTLVEDRDLAKLLGGSRPATKRPTTRPRLAPARQVRRSRFVVQLLAAAVHARFFGQAAIWCGMLWHLVADEAEYDGKGQRYDRLAHQENE